MTILEKKVDAIARSLLAVNPASRSMALKDLEQIMAGNLPVGTVQEEIDQILTHLGIPSRLVGYQHLAAAIRLCVKDESLAYNITKRLYPETAAHCGSTKSRVERGIRHAIELCFDRCDPEIIECYFGSTTSPEKGKLTNSEFIVRIANIVRRRTEGGVLDMCFRICPVCGAHLDPGETCDCKEKAASEAETFESSKD